jgi:hypothetical protein
MTKKSLVILANAVVSLTLVGVGFIGMALRDPILGGGYEFSTLMWIGGLITLFLIPAEICVLKSEKPEK